MLVLSSDQIRSLVSMPALIDAIESAFRVGCIAPPRVVAKAPGGQGDRLLLMMPAFDNDGSGAVKIVTVFPDNAAGAKPVIQGAILLFSVTGTPTALLDGATVTQLRTGAASALASRYLSRADSSHLVLVGTGALLPSMAAAHCAVRPIRRISIWGRRLQRAGLAAAAVQAAAPGIVVKAVDDLASAVSEADIVSCATSSPTPVIKGEWLRPGAFVDLVGSFSPARRESDDEVVRRARIFVDTFEGALTEAGDIIDPLARGVIERGEIEAELADLVCGRATGRRLRDDIILFKSVGCAVEDLAAARLILNFANTSIRGSKKTQQLEVDL